LADRKNGTKLDIGQQFIDAGWCLQEDLYNRDSTAPGEITRYAELVYFHPFIRRFLYGDADHKSVLRIYKRTDVKKMHIVLRKDYHGASKELEFDVDRVHFYLFSNRAKITCSLVVE